LRCVPARRTTDEFNFNLGPRRRHEQGMSTSSLMGQVKGGGRMYMQNPLAGYTEEEMVAEAKNRIQSNKQHRRLKQLLSAASEDGSTVATKDLLLAAKLAKMDLPEAMVADTPFATGVDGVGVPTKIAWRQFYQNLPPPALRGPGGFKPEELPMLRKNRVVKVEAEAQYAEEVVVKEEGPSNEEVEYWFKIMQEKMQTRFAELRRAFRTLDADASGQLERDEFKNVLIMFNLGIPNNIMDKLIDLADFDGDGTINFAEFARIFTAENVHNMKQTLQAVGDAHAAKVRYTMAQGGKGKLDKETGENVRLRRTGPGLEKMKKAHRTLRSIILNRYPSMKECFKAIDADGSGLARRAELRAFLGRLSKSIPDNVISGLIAYVDTDGDAKTLSEEEFLRMMSEEFLDEL